MLLVKVLLIPLPPRVISAVDEYCVPIVTRMGLRSQDGLVKCETFFRLVVSFSQSGSIMVDDGLVRICLITLKWSAAVNFSSFTGRLAYFLDNPCNDATPQCTPFAEVMCFWVFLHYLAPFHKC